MPARRLRVTSELRCGSCEPASAWARCDLPAAGHSADDDHQRQPGLPREPLGEREQVACDGALTPVLGAGGMLGGAQQRDLRAHQRPVGGVERDQPIIARVAAGLPVGVHQRAARTARPRSLRGPSPGTRGHRRRLAHAARRSNSMQSTISSVSASRTCSALRSPWTLAHETAPRAGVEHLRVRHHERVREALQLRAPIRPRALLDDRQQLVEVLRRPPLDGERRDADRRDPARAGGETAPAPAPPPRPRRASAHPARASLPACSSRRTAASPRD